MPFAISFVSSVTYGRVFYMLVESTSSRQDMESKLELAYGAFDEQIEGEVDTGALNELEDLKIKVIAHGGNTSGPFRLAGQSDPATVAAKLAEGADIPGGLPLSYVVRSVGHPDKVVGARLTAEYHVVACEVEGQLRPALYTDLMDLFAEADVVVAHNLSFDLQMLEVEATRIGQKVPWPERKVCTIEATEYLKGFSFEKVG